MVSPKVLAAFPVCLVLAAHFLRAGWWPLSAVYLAAPWLMATGRLWALNVNRVLLWLGVAAWLLATAGFIDERLEQKKPFVRLALIMTTVTALTAGAARVLGSDEVRDGFR
ncbi:MAG: hypothetical protein HY925_05230 [Elusimicrobia bacterium]|nr:hypothetical protein [Elusimicrobiota bacterium]